MANDTNSVDVQFPVNGIAISSGFFPDRPLTSQIASNVRSFDAIAERKRGGSRAGITKYVPEQLGGSSGSFVFYDNVAGATTWTAPVDIAGGMIVEVWGGGGCPPATGTGDPSGTNGGGGGGYSRLDAFIATPGAVYPYTVGAGGTGGNVDGGESSFNTASAIANGGLANGSGGPAGTGDFAYVGGNGGASGVGLGGGGGGSSGYFLGNGNNGSDGQASNTGGTGGTGFPESSPNPEGAGGDGATGDAGLEVAAGPGLVPGGGGGGGCSDTGGIDPAWLNSGSGADGAIKITYSLSNPIQHLAQLTVLDADLIITSFENYTTGMIPDPSSNNFPDGNPNGSLPTGYGNRNPDPARMIPPTGGAGYPVRNKPTTPRRRIIVTPSATSVTNGTTAQLNISLVSLPGSVAVGSGVVKVQTIPDGQDGDGATGTTNGSGQVTINVLENNYEGTILYVVSHTFTNSKNKKVTCTGTAEITWVPNYSLVLSFPFTSHENLLDFGASSAEIQKFIRDYPFVATLTSNADGSPVAGRALRIKTLEDLYNGSTLGCSFNASAYNFHNNITAFTDENGQVKFYPLDFHFVKFVTKYTVQLLPKKTSSTSSPLTSNVFQCNFYTRTCS